MANLKWRQAGGEDDDEHENENEVGMLNRKEQLFLHFFFCSSINRGKPNVGLAVEGRAGKKNCSR